MSDQRFSGATIRDVARVAGVSHMTVSRVVNDSGPVSAETRERIERAIKDLDYRPNGIARALATKQSRMIGVLCTDSGHFDPPKTLLGIEWAARDAGRFVSLANLAELERENVKEAIDVLLARGVDALVAIVSQERMKEVLADMPLPLPTVIVSSEDLDGYHGVSIDQDHGARLATRHLIELGHQTIAHISGPTDWLESTARVRGWQSTLAEHGLTAPEVWVGDWSIEAGRRWALEAWTPEVTGVFASNDHMALGALVGLAERGVRVPEDVSVVGFDDIPEAAWLTPALTTVKPDYATLGEDCMTQLQEHLEGGAARPHTYVRPELVIRKSTQRRAA